LVLWNNRKQIYKPKLKKNYPNVCIIIPCFNEEKTIAKTVQSLLDLDYPKDKLEIIIVDDGSTDKTYQQASLLLKYRQVKLFHKENGGKYTALNYGLERTQAEFVGCLDADSFVESDSLKLAMAQFTDPKVMAVTISVKIYQPQNILQQIQRIEFILGIFLRRVFAFLNSITVVPGPFSIFRRQVFEELGPYRHGYNTEDSEITFRMQSKHYRIANAPDAYVYTVGPRTFKKLLKQRKRWYQGFIKNAWDYKFMILNKKYGDLGLFIMPTIFLSLLFSIIINFYIIFQIGQEIIHAFIFWGFAGFNFNHINLNLNWFFLNTEPHFFLSILLLGITLIIILLGKKLSQEKIKIEKDFLYFLLFYNPLLFIWWLSAIFEIISNKKNQW
jgi:cellulose synthase/poly-beta-1,6-N-acetylglucosamine synthase-like glycosyltransferase